MAKMLKHLVFGQRKNPPAPPRPDYEGDKVEEEEPFSEHDYENISRFRCQVRFGENQKELLVFDNYSEPADLRSEISALEEALYIAPLDDCCHPSAPPLQEEDEEEVYCVPYDAPPSPQGVVVPPSPLEDATYDVVPDADGEVVEYDEPWEWSVAARLTDSLQVSPSPLEEDEEAMRRQRRLLYETAFDSIPLDEKEVGGACVAGAAQSRAASRSSFGSSTGSSASSTPTHRHQRHLATAGGRSASPPQSRPPLNQNFERKISFSPQWCCPQDRSSSQESMGAAKQSPSRKELLVAKTDAKVDRGCSVIQLPQDDPEHHKENKDQRSPPLPLPPQSPDNDVRPCTDYDLPWDAMSAPSRGHGRPVTRGVNGSKSVPEKLSLSQHENVEAGEETDNKPTTAGSGQSRPNLNLGSNKGRRLTLDFGCSALGALGEKVDPHLSLEKQGWYHGSISRVDAEAKLRVLKEGSYLVRNSESSRQDYSLSLRSARGFMHMKIVATAEGRFVLGQFSNPFASIPEMIQHYSLNKLPIKGAEHMSLLHPCIEQLL